LLKDRFIISLVTFAIGIGFAICKELATHKDLHVILTARNESLGKAAVQQLITEHGFQNIEFAPLDIANKDSVSAMAEFLKNKYQGLDILINNAGT
jgi:NAD(P)-dependent dehydrogenase (short-subunit alcohol dehydrogenase family)